MKKTKYIFCIFTILIFSMLLMFCGCSRQQTSAAGIDSSKTGNGHDNFAPMAEIRIQTEMPPTDEYIEGKASAVWTDFKLSDETISIKVRGNSSKESEKNHIR